MSELWNYVKRFICFASALGLTYVMIVGVSDGFLLEYHPVVIIMFVLMTAGSYGIALNIEKLQACFVLLQLMILLMTALQFIFLIINGIFDTSFNVRNWFEAP